MALSLAKKHLRNRNPGYHGLLTQGDMLVAMSSLMLSMTAHPFFNASDAAVASATSTVTIGSAPSYWSQMPSAAPPGGGDAYTISVGTALVFKYSVDHNVWLLPDGAAWSSCNFVGKH